MQAPVSKWRRKGGLSGAPPHKRLGKVPAALISKAPVSKWRRKGGLSVCGVARLEPEWCSSLGMLQVCGVARLEPEWCSSLGASLPVLCAAILWTWTCGGALPKAVRRSGKVCGVARLEPEWCSSLGGLCASASGACGAPYLKGVCGVARLEPEWCSSLGGPSPTYPLKAQALRTPLRTRAPA
eukprot:XP_001691887.1 predicted protein [Chlamydomonas reinhardtii]